MLGFAVFGNNNRTGKEAFWQGETSKVSYGIFVAFLALASLLRAFCRVRGISGCSVTVLADLGHMGCFVDDYLLV